MPQLVVRKVEEKIVARLKERAGRNGVSMEEEHRRILREALAGKRAGRKSFKDYLLEMPNIGGDNLFERRRERPRKVRL